MVRYAIEGLNMFGGGKALCLCNLVALQTHIDG
jgi:hypothetical protein